MPSDFLSLGTWYKPTHLKMQKSITICIQMIFQWDLFSRLAARSLCLEKQTKAIFALGWFVQMAWKKEMVAAFINYGNLLNGLWQSHWRSLFRCRWLPPYWLPLSLLQLPVRKEKKAPSTFYRLTANHYRCLSVYETDWLPVYRPSQVSLAHVFPLTRYKFSINAAKREETVSQLDFSCMRAHGGREV